MPQAYHTLVTGDSGGGKTTRLREMHAEYRGLSVWIDHTGTDGIDGRALEDAETVTSEREARRASSTRLRWRCSDPLPAVAAARRVLRDYHAETGHPSQLIVDEAQDQALPDGIDSDNPLKQSLHQDRDQRTKVVVATQDPSDLNYTALKQCRWFTWVGPWSTFHDGFLRYFSIPRDDLPTERFEWVRFDKRMKPVARGETKEQYS
jgi:DNA helicase HerA-like ATPase